MTKVLQDIISDTKTIKANSFVSMPATGRFIRCADANGTFEISFNNGAKVYFTGGISYTLPDHSDDFTSIQLWNDTNEDIDVTLIWGFGQADDNRLSVSAPVQVQNLSGQSLSVRDSEARSYLFHLRNSIDLIADAQGERNGRLAISPKVDLNNASYAKIHDGTGTIVTAEENTDGVIIRTLCISARGANGSYVRIGGNDIYHANPTSADTTHIWPEQILVPAGQAIQVGAIGGNSFICMSYEVL